MAAKRQVSVLVVDDDGDVREAIALVLEDAGYSVADAANGLEALDVLRTVQPDVILLDLSMPLMSGQEFRVEQLADPSISKIPTVVMSAADRLETKAASIQPAETLPKPIKMPRLLEIVARHGGLQRPPLGA
jgi:CheY-like chemotaxis protein